METADGTALNVAASTGNVEILLALLEAGANANSIDDLTNVDFPLLMEATRRGLAVAVRALVHLGRVDSSETDERGVFPLLEASRGGFPDVVRALLAGGSRVLPGMRGGLVGRGAPDADQATTIVDRFGDEREGVTALLVACEVAYQPDTLARTPARQSPNPPGYLAHKKTPPPRTLQ